ncbi:MAG: helix-turn-helix domain-containing protein [Geminicoccaceae bacterium]
MVASHHPDPPFEKWQFFSQRHQPLRMTDVHWHSQIELNFLSGGEMIYLINGQLVRFGSQRLGVFWGATPHQVVSQTGENEIVVIYVPIADFLSLNLADRFRRKLMGGGFLVDKVRDPADRILVSRWQNDLQSGRDDLKELVRHEIACRIRRLAVVGYRSLRGIDVAAKPERSPNDKNLRRVRDMTVMMATHFAEPLSVEKVAKAAGVHPNYAMTLFRRAIGMTISDYLVRQRLSHAQAMLIDTDLSIDRVARRSGFRSQSRFYEAFAQWVGKSPARYRAELVGATTGASLD